MSTSLLSLSAGKPTNKGRHWCRAFAAAVLSTVLVACGGSGDDDAAAITSASSVSAKAFKGTITELISPTNFSVEGIAVDASAASLPSNLAVGVQVEVAGVMSNGVITATRVKFEGAAPSDDSRRPNRIEGLVTAFTSVASFAVDGIPVDASGAERMRGTLAVGVRVDVRGIVVDGVLIAHRVKVEDKNGRGDDSDDDNGVMDELEGSIATFNSATNFTVGSTPVNASGVGSLPPGLGVGVRVEMDGRLVDGVFIATTLKIDD